MADVTPEGERLIKDWQAAQERLVRARSEVNGAECAVNNAMNALGRWLAPDDAEKGEKIAVWYGDSLVQVEIVNPFSNDYEITIRQRGRSLRR